VPLIIAGDAAEFGEDDDVESLYKLAKIAPELQRDRDFARDAYGRTIYLTERGIQLVESAMGRGDLYAHGNEGLVARVSHALHAEYLLSRDRDYIVRGGKVELVDEFTGRVAERRRWPEGLQAAIEAKEGLPIQSAGMILNSIPLQHFLQLYTKQSGMTATAAAAHEELREFYGLHVVTVPPNRPCIREDHPDVVLATRSDKLEAVVGEIERVHARRRPVLAGTASVRESERLASALGARGIHCAVLNAKNDAQEAAIVAEAGRLGAVTISTNMAGRGTDIRLGGGDEEEHEAVAALGGLYVIGTNRFESRRIDNQLRGRAGRQGDPGSSRFFVSLEDDLLIKYRLKELIPKPCRTVSAGTDLKHPVIGKEIDRVQRIAEGQNLEVKKMLCRYTLLLEQQRTIMRQRREEILFAERIPAGIAVRAAASLERLTHVIPETGMVSLCKRLVLCHTDRLWSHYLSAMAETREGIHLRTYGKQDPLFEYQKSAIELFEALHVDIERAVCRALKDLAARGDVPGPEAAPGKAPSTTWTYTISDTPFEDIIRQLLGAGGVGLNAWAGLLWPLTALLGMVMRYRRKRETSDTISKGLNQRSSD
jgi:preprotein translocase subunit SecA